MPELGEIGREYMDTAQALFSLRDQQQGPGPSETYDDAILEAELILDILDTKGASQDFAQLLEQPATEDPEVSRQQRVIEGLRNSDLYKRGIITEDDIQKQLNDIQRPDEISEEQGFAAAYFIGKALSRVSFLPKAKDTAGQTEPGPDPEPKAGNPEEEIEDAEPGSLTLKIYRGDNMLVIGDQAIPLARATDTAQNTADAETMLEEYRVAAMQALAKLSPGQEMTVAQIWDEINVSGESIPRAWWNGYMSEFIEGLSHNGQALFKVRKPTPDAKRRYYSVGDVPLAFEFEDAESGIQQLTNYKLPNGKVLSGKAGKLMHLLTKAKGENPVTHDSLVQYEIYSPEEIAANKLSDSTLSNLVSSIRSALNEAGLSGQYIIRKIDLDIKSDKNRAKPGYYLEILSQEDVVKIGEAKRVMSYIKSKCKALALAGLGVPSEFPDDSEDLQTKNGGNKVSDQELLRQWIDFVQTEDIFSIPDSDVRWDLINYLWEVAEDESLLKVFRSSTNIDTSSVATRNGAEKPETELQKITREVKPVVKKIAESLHTAGLLKGVDEGIHVTNLGKVCRSLGAKNIPKSMIIDGGKVKPTDAIELILRADDRFVHIFQSQQKQKIKHLLREARNELARFVEANNGSAS